MKVEGVRCEVERTEVGGKEGGRDRAGRSIGRGRMNDCMYLAVSDR